jgi:hypothetical protein
MILVCSSSFTPYYVYFLSLCKTAKHIFSRIYALLFSYAVDARGLDQIKEFGVSSLR